MISSLHDGFKPTTRRKIPYLLEMNALEGKLYNSLPLLFI